MPIVKVLMPGFACIVSPGVEADPDPVQEAVRAGFCRIYILQGQDILLHQQLPAGAEGVGRFVCMKVPSLPGNHKIKPIVPGMAVLPAGKIPLELLLTIQKFFKNVMGHFKTKLEAMIWILWSAEKGYYLHVPTQQVGAASARYDWASLPADSEIVVDIHSHADMGAFFSGTDDADDRVGVRYSGVIGHNSRPEPEMKFRFNFMGSKVEVQLADLFFLPPPASQDPPSEWLQKVSEVGHYVPPTGGRGNSLLAWGASHHKGGAGVTQAPKYLDGSPRYIQRSFALGDDEDASEDIVGSTGFGGVGTSSRLLQGVEAGEKVTGLRRAPGPKAGSLPAEEGPPIVEIHGSKFVLLGEDVISLEDWQRSQQIREEEEMELSIQKFLAGKASGRQGDALAEFCAQERDDPFTKAHTDAHVDAAEAQFRAEQEELLSGSPETPSSEDDVLSGLPEDLSEDPRFDAMAVNFGVNVATAFVIIDEASSALANSGEPLNRTVETLFDMVDEGEKLEVLRKLYQGLASRDQMEIATGGF